MKTRLTLLVALAANPLLAQTDTARAPVAGTAHADEVRHVAFDATGRWLVSMDESTVKTWSLPDGKRVGLAAIEGGASVIESSPTEPLVAILRKDYAVELRTLPELKLVRSWKTGQFTDALAFNHDGSTIATGGVRFWRTADGTQVREIKLSEFIHALAFSPDGKWLATSGDGPRLGLWRLDDLTRVHTMGSYSSGVYFTVSFTPDSSHLVAGSNNDQWSVWRVPSGQPAAIKTDGRNGLWTVTAGSDATTFFSADGGRIKVWNLPDGTERLAFEGHQGQVNSIAASPDRATFATAGEDRRIRIWRLADGSPVQDLVDRTSVAKATPLAPKAAVAAKPASAAAGLVVSGRLVYSNGQPVADFALKLPLAYPDESGGLFLSFGPNFYEATTGADGRFRIEGVKPGERYALVDMSGGRPSYLKRADGSTLLLEFAKEIKNKTIDLGDIPVEFR